MSEREQYFEAKKLLSEIQRELDTAPLTLQQRKELELHARQTGGRVASSMVSGGVERAADNDGDRSAWIATGMDGKL
jgi:hypothetical protein